MTRALALAERGLETTHPNPRVGCVLAKGDRIIGEGWHERAGEPHAEIMALRSAKEPVAGATAYVTLEPCSHHGRTPPCANALIEARIARVVFAVQDPNPRVSGQGADALLRAGITVEAGLMQNEATELNIGFMKRMKEGLPWVRVKLAMSLDGRTALANGASQWITGEPARADVQRWRARCSAVMTGVGTVLADDPLLNVRLQGFKGRQPLRVVLDARLRSPPGAKMFASLAGVGGAGAGAPGGAGAARAPGVGGGDGVGAQVAARTQGAVGAAGGAAGAGSGAAGAAKAGGVGGQAGAAVAGAVAGGGARVGVANVPPGVASGAGVVGGPVLIFAAADGGFGANTGVGRGAVMSDPSTLSDDMAELVNAFETSPTAVSARTDSVAGPVSVKAEPRTASLAQAAGSSKAPTAAPAAGAAVTGAPAAGAVAAGAVAAGAAPSKAPVTSPAGSANSATPAASSPASTPSATQAPSLAATSAAAQDAASTSAAVGGSSSAVAAVPPMGVAAAPGAAANDGTGVSPPVLAAAGDAAGVAPTSDDATWAGAALSGAVPVKRETETPSNGATPPANPATPLAAGPAGIHAATVSATAVVSGANGAVAPPAGTTAVANSATPSASGAAGPAPAAVTPANAMAGVSSSASAHGASSNAASGPAGASPQPVLSKAVVAPKQAVESPQNAAPMQSTAMGQGGAAQTPTAQTPAAQASAAQTAAPVQTSAAPAQSAAPVRAAAPAQSAAPTQAAAPRQAAAPAQAAASAQAAAPTQAAAPAQTNAREKPAAAKADSPAAFQARKVALVGKGVRIEEVPADEGFLDLFTVLKKLGDMEVNEVLVEAGPTLAGQLLTTFFVDELLLYVAPKLLGPQGRPLVNLPELQSLQDAWGFSLFDAKRFGDDLRLRMRPK